MGGIDHDAGAEFFADGADTAALMMDKTIDALLDHDRKNTFNGLSLCDLDIRKGIGASYMCRDASPSSLWRHLWASAEIEINKMKFESYRRSQGQLTQHKERNTAVLKKGWELGDDFVNANEKNRAIKKVGDALIIATTNSVTKATILMSDLVSKLVKSPHFDEDSILTEDRRKDISRTSAIEWFYGDFFPDCPLLLPAVTSAWRSMRAVRKKVAGGQAKRGHFLPAYLPAGRYCGQSRISLSTRGLVLLPRRISARSSCPFEDKEIKLGATMADRPLLTLPAPSMLGNGQIILPTQQWISN
jgi:hypothetical protein